MGRRTAELWRKIAEPQRRIVARKRKSAARNSRFLPYLKIPPHWKSRPCLTSLHWDQCPCLPPSSSAQRASRGESGEPLRRGQRTEERRQSSPNRCRNDFAGVRGTCLGERITQNSPLTIHHPPSTIHYNFLRLRTHASPAPAPALRLPAEAGAQSVDAFVPRRLRTQARPAPAPAAITATAAGPVSPTGPRDDVSG